MGEHGQFQAALDVMLPAKLQPPRWPTDKARWRQSVRDWCRRSAGHLHQQMPERMIVKMIEESYNEPFKTGPLIDQQGHYAIFDILMNRQMFDYITVNSPFVYQGRTEPPIPTSSVDFPAGNESGSASLAPSCSRFHGRFCRTRKSQAKNFHMVKALVLMPPGTERGATVPAGNAGPDWLSRCA